MAVQLNDTAKAGIKAGKTILTFTLQKTLPEAIEADVTEVTAIVKDELADFDLATPLTNDDVIQAAFDLFDIESAATETKVDDEIDAAGKALYQILHGKGLGLIPGIKALIALHKAKVADAKS